MAFAPGAEFAVDLLGAADRANVEVFLGAGPDDDPARWAFASVPTHVGESSPPLLLIHSEVDPVVPVRQSLQLAAQYAEAGVAVELVLLPDAPHAFWNFETWFDDAIDRAATFFRRHLANEGTGAPGGRANPRVGASRRIIPPDP